MNFKEPKSKHTVYLVRAAAIAAVYVVLTFVFAPISFGEVQVRIAEALTILPLFTPGAVPGLFAGCLLGNILGGAALPDILFGSLATLLGALGTRMLRERKPVWGVLPPILSNTIIVPFILRYAYGILLPVPFMMLTVGIGEVLSCGVLGMLVYTFINKYRNVLFPSGE